MKKLPKGRTLTEFEPLKPAEHKLLEACKEGKAAQLSNTRPSEKSNDNIVRASFIRFLALGGDDDAAVHESGVYLKGAWIEGILSFNGAVIPRSLSIQNSHLERKPILKGTEIAGELDFSGSTLPGLQADRTIIKDSLLLSNGFTSTSEIRLIGARIGSSLEFIGAQLNVTQSNAISADNAVIKGSVFLSKGFSSNGEIRLLGAQIDGNLSCKNAKLNVKEGNSISADRAAVKGSIFLSEGFTATGTIRLVGAQIEGSLSCQGAKLNTKEGDAILADRALIKGDVHLTNGFHSNGKIRLHGAQINGNLACNSAKLNIENGDALSADGAVIQGGVFLSKGFTTTGTIRLLGTQIGGNFSLEGAQLNKNMGATLSADGMIVNGAFFLRNLKSPAYDVRLSSAKVGRLIDDRNSWGERLVLDGFLYERLAGGSPTSAQSRLTWLKKQTTKHLNQENFRPQPWKQLQTVLRNMGHAEEAKQIAIAFEDHLRTEKLIGKPPSNLPKWMETPYQNFNLTIHYLFRALIGYGYRPLRLVMWMLGVWLLCASIYWSAALQGVMAPSQPLVFQNMPKYESCIKNWYLCEELPEAYTGFSPLAYSLDLLLPLVNLQQEQDWAPLVPTPKNTWHEEFFGNWTFKHIVRFTVWFEILFGWLASLLLVAVVSGLTKRSEDRRIQI